MYALLLTDQGVRLDSDWPAPAPEPGEALIRVRLAGICSTDLQLIAGYKGGYRGVLGHEFVGEVVAAADDPTWVGHRIVGELNVGCGRCDLCRRGLGKHCRQRQSLGIIGRDGAFAEYLTLPLANLHRVPAVLSDEQAVFTEPLAAALEILEQVHISPAQRVFVVGAGRLGLLIAQALALTGCDLIVLGRTPAKLQLLRELGVAHAYVTTPDLPAELVAQPADVVVEATGSPAGIAHALRLLRPQGTLVLKSTFAGGVPDFDLSRLVVDEIRLVGSRCGPFQPALNQLAAGRIQVTPLIHACYPLTDAPAALEHAGRKGVIKVLIRP